MRDFCSRRANRTLRGAGPRNADAGYTPRRFETAGRASPEAKALLRRCGPQAPNDGERFLKSHLDYGDGGRHLDFRLSLRLHLSETSLHHFTTRLQLLSTALPTTRHSTVGLHSSELLADAGCCCECCGFNCPSATLYHPTYLSARLRL